MSQMQTLFPLFPKDNLSEPLFEVNRREAERLLRAQMVCYRRTGKSTRVLDLQFDSNEFVQYGEYIKDLLCEHRGHCNRAMLARCPWRSRPIRPPVHSQAD